MLSGSCVGELAGRRARSACTIDARAALAGAPATSASIRAAPTAPIQAYSSGTNSSPSAKPKASRSACDGALVGGHAADEGDRRLDELALGDRALVVADDGVAEALEHLGRLVALLLRVDHVGLGEHAAAAGDAGGLAGAEHDVADVFDLVEQPAGLLVHERAGAGGAVAVRLIVGDADAARVAIGLEPDELARLAAHLEHGHDVGMKGAETAGDRLELVLERRRAGPRR